MARIEIKGTIVSNDDKWIYEWLEMDATSPRDVSNAIEKANGEDLELEINSGGGSVFAGSEIYTLLKDYQGNVTAKILGIAASAASVIAMAAKTIKISPTAQIMIHNVSSRAWGDYRDMQQQSEVLKNYNTSIANAYRLKTNMDENQLLELMNKETWLNAQQAKELGFADEIMFDDANQLVAGINTSVLPQEVVNKIRNYMHKPLDSGKAAVVEDKKNEEESVMTVEEMKNKHPELYNQILNEGRNQGIQNERARMQNLDDLAMPGNEEIINKAKYESGITAEEAAMQIIKAEKAKGSAFLENRKKDVEDSNVNGIDGAPAPQNHETKAQQEEKEAEELANAVNKRRGI
ncbi:phage protein [Clostridium aceticum]|uniref:ATP-dependent Clp protease proteolytic subunit n=1 Tax=Clostridium aceticum TaxID=84022 RepID=A0A0G3WAS6_9CLOT|nr:head maturation protease, ClpP-related [Clostridium aceticum]AKL95007.1 phage protein [Clostridium aceticum]